MKLMDPKTEELFSVVAVTENLQDAKLLLEVFLIGYSERKRKAVLTELENRDSRFKGWDASFIYEYDYTKITGDTLYIGRNVAKQIKAGKMKVKLLVYEVV